MGFKFKLLIWKYEFFPIKLTVSHYFFPFQNLIRWREGILISRYFIQANFLFKIFLNYLVSIDGSWFLFTENLYTCIVIAFIRLFLWFHHMITNDIENNNIKTVSLQVNFCRDYKQICRGISQYLKFLKFSHVNQLTN